MCRRLNPENSEVAFRKSVPVLSAQSRYRLGQANISHTAYFLWARHPLYTGPMRWTKLNTLHPLMTLLIRRGNLHHKPLHCYVLWCLCLLRWFIWVFERSNYSSHNCWHQNCKLHNSPRFSVTCWHQKCWFERNAFVIKLLCVGVCGICGNLRSKSSSRTYRNTVEVIISKQNKELTAHIQNSTFHSINRMKRVRLRMFAMLRTMLW
jgi:hypothetical protein